MTPGVGCEVRETRSARDTVVLLLVLAREAEEAPGVVHAASGSDGEDGMAREPPAGWDQANMESRPWANELLNRRVRVYWAGDKRWSAEHCPCPLICVALYP